MTASLLCLPAATGSTDNTIEVVQNFFDKQALPGSVAHHAWQDFGHNRNLCIKVGQPFTSQHTLWVQG